MSLEEFKNIEDLYKAKTFGTIQRISLVSGILFLELRYLLTVPDNSKRHPFL
jgi:hypothetical protein